jgi:hypothetical protein
VHVLAQKQAQVYFQNKSSKILRVNITENSAYSGYPDVVPDVAIFGSTFWTYGKIKLRNKNPTESPFFTQDLTFLLTNVQTQTMNSMSRYLCEDCDIYRREKLV